MGACMSVNEQTQEIEIGWQVWEKRKERRRLAADVAAAEAKEAALLAGMPGRLCSNGVTKSCCLHTKRGDKGPVNQDSMLVWEGFVSTPGPDQQNSVFCGVFDGHGPSGHRVAKKVRDALPSMLLASLQDDHNHDHDHDHDPCENAHNTTEEENPAAQQQSLHSSTTARNDNNSHDNNTGSHGVQHQPCFTDSKFISAFDQMDHCLKSHPIINCHSSGTTAVAVIIQGHELVVGNVGDSRAIIAQKEEDGNLIVDQLTTDLKPDLPGEEERIKSSNGRVFSMRDEPHVARLWLPHVDSPGLAMARALGDFCLKDYGLICTPQISRRTITEHHEFMVLATDGVWDVLSNDEVVKIVFDCEVKEEAAKSIVNEAKRRWKRKEHALEARMDDCAVVCHFFKQDLNQYIYSSNKKGIRKFPTIDFKSKHKFGYLNVLERGKTQRGYTQNEHHMSIDATPPPLSRNESVERGV